MQVAALEAGFLIGVASFAAWLLVMLRHDRAHRLHLIAPSHGSARTHRPVVPATRMTSVAVARAGSFCRVPGNIGHTKKGVVLVCEASTTGRPRWRRAEVVEIAN